MGAFRRHSAGTRHVRHHQRHRARGGRQVHVLVGFTQRRELRHHVDRYEPGALERLQQAVASVYELFDLLTRHLSTTSELTEHPLAIGPGLVHHFATLLLGHLDFGLGVGSGVLTSTRRLELGLFAKSLDLVGRFTKQSGCALLGPATDLGGGFASGAEDASSLLAEHPRDQFLVDRHRGRRGGALRLTQLALEEALALLQACQFGCDHAKELSHLGLFETLARHGERSSGNRRRRRRVGTREGDGHRRTAYARTSSGWWHARAAMMRSGGDAVRR